VCCSRQQTTPFADQSVNHNLKYRDKDMHQNERPTLAGRVLCV